MLCCDILLSIIVLVGIPNIIFVDLYNGDRSICSYAFVSNCANFIDVGAGSFFLGGVGATDGM